MTTKPKKLRGFSRDEVGETFFKEDRFVQIDSYEEMKEERDKLRASLKKVRSSIADIINKMDSTYPWLKEG